jgi:DNA-binding XRE family transcriptional regulator
MTQTLTIDGKRFTLMEEREYKRLRRAAGPEADVELPRMPDPLPDGNYPALEAARASLARKIIRDRWAVRLTQAELAKRAGIRAETLNRIEKARVTPDLSTIKKIDKALAKAEREME